MGQEIKETVEKREVATNYIKIGAIMRLGDTNASIIQRAYSSDSAEKKMEAIAEINKSDMSIETKLKFIGDIITRPKKERVAIANSLKKLLEAEKGE